MALSLVALTSTGLVASAPVRRTICPLALSSDRGIDGVDLSPALRGEAPPPRLEAYSHSTVLVRGVHSRMYAPEHRHKWELLQQYFPDEKVDWIWVALRDGDTFYKLRQLEPGNWGLQVFDLAAGTGEETDLFDPENERHVQAARRLLEYKRHLVSNFRQQQGLSEEEEIQVLRGLGYVQ